MYFSVKDNKYNTLCEIDIYTEQDPYMDCFWNIRMKVWFNIGAYSEFLIDNFDTAKDIKHAFAGIQNFVLDLNEHISGDYPEFLQYDLDDPAFKEAKSQVIKVTRNRLYNIVQELGYTGIYINED